MTRAADRLIVCGADGERQRPKGCWYDLVVEPLRAAFDRGRRRRRRKRLALSQGAAGCGGKRRPPQRRPRSRDHPNSRHGCGGRAPAEAPRSRADLAVEAFEEDRRAVAHGRALRPSGARRCARGRIVHRLMQSLPDIPPARAQGRHRALSEKRSRRFAPAERGEMAAQVARDARRSALSPTCSRREAAPRCRSSAGSRATARPRSCVAGQVDRLAVTPRRC